MEQQMMWWIWETYTHTSTYNTIQQSIHQGKNLLHWSINTTPCDLMDMKHTLFNRTDKSKAQRSAWTLKYICCFSAIKALPTVNTVEIQAMLWYVIFSITTWNRTRYLSITSSTSYFKALNIFSAPTICSYDNLYPLMTFCTIFFISTTPILTHYVQRCIFSSYMTFLRELGYLLVGAWPLVASYLLPASSVVVVPPLPCLSMMILSFMPNLHSGMPLR